MNQIVFLKRTTKIGTVLILVVVLISIGLVARLRGVFANGDAKLFVTHLGTNLSESPDEDWSHSVSADDDDFVQLFGELSTNGETEAKEVTIKFEIPSGKSGGTTTKLIASSTTEGVDSKSEKVVWNWRGASCQLVFVGGSASAKVDRNRNDEVDDNDELDINGPIADDIVGAGVNFGLLSDGSVQVNFKAKVECDDEQSPPNPTPSLSPSPTASPNSSPLASPSQSPVVGGTTVVNNTTNNTNINNNENKSENKVEVKVENNPTQTQTQTATTSGGVTPAVAGAATSSAALKGQPETGVGVMGMATLFGAAPFGFMLTRFGRGRVMVPAKTREELGKFASGLFQTRKSKRI